MANSVDLDEVAHNEPPHQDLHCLQIKLVSSLVLNQFGYNIPIPNHFILYKALMKISNPLLNVYK